MKLTRLSLHNFMPYKGPQSIDFPTGSANVAVIYGDNMRGKTSLLNAIRFAFFGKATGRSLHDIAKINLINVEAAEAGDWTASVAIDFEHAGSLYELRREIRRLQHIARPQDDRDLKEVFSVRKDGIPLSGRDLAFEMNQVLPEGISRFFLFDGELLQEYEVLVRDPASSGKIKGAIEAILGVPALTKGLAEIQALLGQAQAVQAEELKHSKALRAQAEQQIALQQRLTKLRAERADIDEKKDGFDIRIFELAESLEKLSNARDFEIELVKKEGELSVQVERIAKSRSQRAALLQDAWKDLIEPRVQLLRRDLASDRDTLMERFAERAVILQRVKELQNSVEAGECSLCATDLDDDHKTHLARYLGDLEGRLAGLDADLEKLTAVSSKMESLARLRGDRLSARVVGVETEMRKAVQSKAALDGAISELRARLAEYSGSEAERLRAERDQLIILSGSLARELEAKVAEIGSVTRKLDQVSRLMSRNPEARQQRSSRLVSVYSALERVFAASVGVLRDRQRNRVQDYASDAFRKLTSEADYQGLAINENYGLSIIDDKNRVVAERSAGAEQIVALALIDGLNRAGRRGGPIVMDTPFGRLDWVHRKNVLSYLPEMAEQVILLVHEGEMDRERDLPPLRHKVGAMYRIERISARHSELVLEQGTTQ